MHVSHVKHARTLLPTKPLSLGDCEKWQNSRDNVVPTEITIENPINY